MLDRVTFDNDVMGGQACIRHLRIPVATIVKLVAVGRTPPEILKEYPDLEAEDIHQSLLYAARLTEDKTIETAIQ